ncbi:MAG TPA: phospholipid carrier-dependent glycosyltransferase [Candidatus Sulfotelmatobacter sp.]|nr:phospholipid carrier-dependent glycosyltransferase [Candidatus Sulfotelmatobacter sp.]
MDSTAPRPGEAAPGREAPRRSDGSPSAIPAIAILLLVGLALRLIIAYVLFPGSGFQSDIGSFTSWALTLAHGGPGGFYANAGFADYPPGYLYVLWILGSIGSGAADLLGGGTINLNGVVLPLPDTIVGGLIKLPAIAADLGIAYLLYRLVRRWLGARSDAHGAALGAAALYLFNPVTWYDSALWGQIDAVGALVMLVAIAFLIDGFSEAAVGFAVVAALVKPQFGIVLAPLIGVTLLRRHLFLIGSGPRATAVPGVLRSWVVEEQGVWRLVSCAAVGAVVLFALITPFGLDVPTLISRMGDTAAGYPYLSVNAYDPWALIGSGGQASLAAGGGWSSDQVPLLAGLNGFTIGAILLGLGFAVGAIQLAWRDSRRSILLTAVFLSLAFFILPTRVHERYLFPVFVFLPLLAVNSRRFRVLTLVLAAGSFINLHGILTVGNYGTANVTGLPFGADMRSFGGVLLSVVLQTGAFLVVAWSLRPVSDLVAGPLRRLAGFAARAPEVDPYDLPPPAPPPPRAYPGSPDVQPAGGSGWGLPRALLARSLRRDRSGELRRERFGLPDRLDGLVVLILIVAAMVLRTWDLGQPFGMIFDEVYHARTATEFLQDWRYGEPHDIYEFTHPHLAKYLIAVGLVAFGDDNVTGTADLGVGTVTDAATEARWSPPDQPGQRDGDRLYLATPGGVVAYDLATRQVVTTVPLGNGRVPVHLTVDPGAHVVYVADDAGGLWSIQTADLDALRVSASAAQPAATRLGTFGGPVTALVTSSDGAHVEAITAAHQLVSLATADGSQSASVADPSAAALVAVPTDSGAGAVAVAEGDTLDLRDAATLASTSQLTLPEAPTGMVLMNGLDQPTIFAAGGSSLSWVAVPSSGGETLGGTLQMPGAVRDVAWDESSNIIHVLGRTPDGSSDTVYVVEPNGKAVFADARLPFSAVTMALDTQPQYPSQDRQQLLAVDSAGQLAVVDIGNHAYAWRIMGVIAGALLLGCLYLLVRMLFRRRTVALLTAGLVLVDGMFFAQSRIAMNDTYVALFIVAAYMLFVPIYLGLWRRRWVVALAIPAIGVLLGLALASKWVGAYAIGGIVLLVLLRSALGRLLALAAMIGMTGVLGWLAIGATSAGAPIGDASFLVLMVVLTAVLAAAIIVRPIRWTLDEVRFAVGAPAVAGGLALLGGIVLGGRPSASGGSATPGDLVLVGAALLVLAVVAYAACSLAGRRGLGPLARARAAPADDPDAPADAPDQGWLIPGSSLGAPWLLALACFTFVPLVVYVISYAPWIALGNQWFTGYPPGHTGQTLLDLQIQMYNYHNDLRASHPASSPWWAWPFDFKPVWFFQQGYANDTTGITYDAGNLVIFWLGVPVIAWASWQAWARRSLALTILVVGFACQWLSWSRIDRASFQYHYYTALPFLFAAVAYFLAELWHGPSPRTWLLARLAAAGALVAAPLLWLVRVPLCSLAGTSRVAPNSQVCGFVSMPFVLTERVAASGIVLLVGGAILVWQVRLVLADRAFAADDQRPGGGGFLRSGAPWLVITAAALLAALALAQTRFGDQALISAPLGALGPYAFAVIGTVPLAVAAWFVLTMRDPRRFVIGILGAATLWFVIFYADISGLPIPTGLKNIFQVLPLPTYVYDFQFAVNTDPPQTLTVLGLQSGSLALVTGALALAVMYAAWTRRAQRLALAGRGGPGPDEPGNVLTGGTA